ncbi:MAG TPA: adenylyl-sulfate kinase [Burkholderiaceae bacterium]|jgi:adenylylsulfate kinase
MISPDVVWHQATVQRPDRERQNGHRSGILWFTGLSGAGKSTLAHAVEQRLHAQGVRTYVLDGDNVRHGLCGDLGFTEADRRENIRRIGEVAKLFVDAGIVVLTAFISPFRADRDRVRHLVAPADFIEIHCRCSVEICETRDVKGLYKKARAGGVKEFTGISSPYEEPLAPELAVETGSLELEQCVEMVLRVLGERGMLPAAQG